MICPICGLSEHPVIDPSITIPGARCVAWLKAELQRKELVIEQCLRALEDAKETIRQNECWGVTRSISSATLVQIQHALDSAKEE